MPTLVATVMGLGLTTASPAPLPPITPPDAAVAVLDNGVRVAVIPDHRAPLVATWVHVAAGAGDEQPRGSGAAHLMEHLMFVGSPRAPDGGYDRLLAELGAENNAWTDHDATAFHCLAPAGALERVLALEADRLGGLPAVLTDDQVAVQQAVVASEADLEAGAPHSRDVQAALRAVFGADHPYGAPVLGSPDARAALDRAAALDLHARRYGGRHLTVVVVGDVDAVEALAAARRQLSGLPAGPARLARDAPPPQPAAPLRLRQAPADRPTVLRAWPTVPAGHPDAPALALLADLLAGAADRPLDAALRAPLDLAVVRAWPWGGERAGLFAVEVGGPVELVDLDAALDAALGPALSSATADAAALERARRAAVARQVRRAEDPLVQAEAAAACLSRTGGVGCAARAAARLRAVTLADLQRVAAQHLTPARGVTVWLSPEGADLPQRPDAVPLELP